MKTAVKEKDAELGELRAHPPADDLTAAEEMAKMKTAVKEKDAELAELRAHRMRTVHRPSAAHHSLDARLQGRRQHERRRRHAENVQFAVELVVRF